MAHLQRLIWFMVGFLVVCVPSLAFATDYELYSSGVYDWGTQYTPGPPAWSHQRRFVTASSPEDLKALVGYSFPAIVSYPNQFCPGGVCERALGAISKSRTTITGGQQIRVIGMYGGGDFSLSVFYNFREIASCAVGQGRDPVTGACMTCETGIVNADGTCFVCPAGRVWNGSTCESPCEAKAGNSYGTSNSWAMLDVDAVPTGSASFCDGLCSVRGGKVECESVSAGGTRGDFVSLGSTCVVQGPFIYTGQDCGPAGSAPQLVGVDDLQKPWWDKGLDFKECSEQGGYWGNVGGIDACVRPQPGETFEKETSTGNETGTETETAADGTTTEKQTTISTECKDGKCTTTTTTTTTTKGADGQQIGSPTTESRTETKQEADFCKLNPQHAQCAGTETGGSFAGSCASGFTCSGDAVQCAIARAQHESTCALAVGDGVLGEFSSIQGFDGTAPGEGLDRKQIDVPTSLDVAEIGGGAGLSDLSITVMGQSIEIPLSELNRFIAMFGYAIMAIAWVGAWRIISGAF